MSDRKSYMNLCPVCEQSFMCEHKRDTRCPYCRIAELEAKLADKFDTFEEWKASVVGIKELADNVVIAELEAKVTEMENILETSIPSKVRELEAQIGYVRNCRDRLRREYTALRDGLRELQRYTVTDGSYTTDNPDGEWIRADELEALLGKEPAPPPATDDGDSSAGGVGSDLI